MMARLGALVSTSEGINSPSIAKELPALVGAKNEKHFLARLKSLIQDRFIMRLSSPQSLYHTKIQVLLVVVVSIAFVDKALKRLDFI
jgi:hypothetical protein